FVIRFWPVGRCSIFGHGFSIGDIFETTVWPMAFPRLFYKVFPTEERLWQRNTACCFVQIHKISDRLLWLFDAPVLLQNNDRFQSKILSAVRHRANPAGWHRALLWPIG